jgi:hypothetical protein
MNNIVSIATTPLLTIAVFDKDDFYKKDDVIGRIEIPLGNFREGKVGKIAFLF